MAQKKKIILKQSNSSSVMKGSNVNQENTINLSIEQLKNIDEIQQSNNVKQYSFNPFQPYEQHIQTQNGVIKIKIK